MLQLQVLHSTLVLISRRFVSIYTQFCTKIQGSLHLPEKQSSLSSSSTSMLRSAPRCLRRSLSQNRHFSQITRSQHGDQSQHQQASAPTPSLSIWRRKQEIGKEGLIAAKELRRLRSDPVRLHRYMASHVSRLLKADLVAVLAEFQRQDQVFLSLKLYDVVRKEIWYRPDMFFYRDMLMMLGRNKQVDEAKRVWQDSKREGVLFDQHTYGDIMRVFLDSGLPSEAMQIYDDMRKSPDPPIFLPFRVILKGLLPYPEMREKVKDDFLEIFPHMSAYDSAEDFSHDESDDYEIAAR